MRSLAFALLVLAPPLHAQTCTFQFLPGPSCVSTDRSPFASTVWDEDGDGPVPPVVVAVGDFQIAGDQFASGIATWDGTRWVSLNRHQANFDGVGLFDPDGPGLQPAQLIVSGYWRAPVGFERRLSRYQSGRWVDFPSVPTIYMPVFAPFDPDGPGPLPPQLIAASTHPQGSQNIIFHWDGSQWLPLGGGVRHPDTYGTVQAMEVFDPDGAGTVLPRLYVTGHFALAGNQSVSNIASWDGTQWAALGSGLGGYGGTSMTVFDADGLGPGPAVLVVSGGSSNVAAWDGASWSAFPASGLPLISSVVSQQLLPGLSVLFASGSSLGGTGVFRWSGESWEPMPGVGGGGRLLSIRVAGGQPLIVQAGGFNAPTGGEDLAGFAAWDGGQWRRSFPGFRKGYDGNAIGTFDPDGAGPRPTELVFARTYYPPGVSPPIGPVVAFDGFQWHPVPGWPGDAAGAFGQFDPDGPGPSPDMLIAWVANPGASRVLAWNGNSWAQLGPTYTNRSFHGFISHDPDGAGPLAPMPIAFGFGPSYGYRVSAWDGADWTPLGPEIVYTEPNPAGATIKSIASYDADGPGPAPTQLYIGGEFNRIGEQTIWSLARWNGASWEAVPGNPLQGAGPLAMTVFDLDGPGPLAPELIMPGFGGTALLAFNGSTWRPVPGPVHGIETFACFDAGAGRPQLYTIGTSSYGSRISFWNGTGWSVVGAASEPSGGLHAHAAVWSHPGLPDELWISGDFLTAGPWPSFGAARFGCPGPPCYANCDGSSIAPVLNINDFLCFINRFQAQDPYANCDGSSADPFLNVADFNCFLNRFTAGCP
jgi:hypothetical protein